jgi:hypothetical protein
MDSSSEPSTALTSCNRKFESPTRTTSSPAAASSERLGNQLSIRLARARTRARPDRRSSPTSVDTSALVAAFAWPESVDTASKRAGFAPPESVDTDPMEMAGFAL